MGEVAYVPRPWWEARDLKVGLKVRLEWRKVALAANVLIGSRKPTG